MNIVDIIIILALLMGTIVGFKRGFFKQTVMFLGTVAVFVFAFLLKGPVAMFLYSNFPFFDFKGLSTLNILLYEGIAFLLLLVVLGLLLRFLIMLTGIIEKILKMTIILGIPSKILGAVVGFFEAYLLIYIALLLFSSPIFNIPGINNSYMKDKVLNDTPVLSKASEDIISTFDDIWALRDSEENNDLNQKIYDIIEKNGFVAKDFLEKLIEKGKIIIDKEE